MREYGQPQKRDNSTLSTLKAIALAGGTAGGLYGFGKLIKPSVQRKLIERMMLDARNLIRNTGGLDQGAYTFAREILENTPDIGNLSVWRALKYVAVQNPVMDFWKKSAEHLLPARIADHLLGIARLREVYSAQSPVLKSLGRLGDNPALLTAAQRETLSKAKLRYYAAQTDIAARYGGLKRVLSDSTRYGIPLQVERTINGKKVTVDKLYSYKDIVQHKAFIKGRLAEEEKAITDIRLRLKGPVDDDEFSEVTQAFFDKLSASKAVLEKLQGLPKAADVAAQIKINEAIRLRRSSIAGLITKYRAYRRSSAAHLSPLEIETLKGQIERRERTIKKLNDRLYNISSKTAQFAASIQEQYLGHFKYLRSKYGNLYRRWRTGVQTFTEEEQDAINKLYSAGEFDEEGIANLRKTFRQAQQQDILNPLSSAAQDEIERMRRFEELIAQREYERALGPQLFGDPTGRIFKVSTPGTLSPGHELVNQFRGIPTPEATIEQMPGMYEFYGTTSGGAGQYKTAFEKMAQNLSTDSTSVEAINARIFEIKRQLETIKVTGAGDKSAYVEKRLYSELAAYEAQLDHSALNAVRQFLDLGLHPKVPHIPWKVGKLEQDKKLAIRARNIADEMLFKEFRNSLSTNIDKFGNFAQGFIATTHAFLLNTSDFSHLRDESLLQYRGIKSLDVRAPKDWLGIVLGGRSKTVQEILGDLPITNTTLQLNNIFNRMNETLARSKFTAWLALSSRSAKTPLGFMGSVFLKRVLPLVALGFYANYANNAIGNYTGHRPTDLLTEARYRVSLGWNSLKEHFGVNRFFRHLDELSGGFINHLAHPFMKRPVGLSPEEYRLQEEHGYQEIRKGRWWWFGSSTPFRGGRIQYFGPTRLQYARSGNPYLTDTLWGDYSEYYANAAFPTLEHPLAPLRHFIFDRYHYERKHYKDRPYPTSAPLFEPTSFWGAILNPTLGRIIKPQIYMHEDDMPYYVHGPNRGKPNPRYKGDRRSIEQQVADKAGEVAYTGFATPSGQINVYGVEPLPGAPYAIDQIQQRDIENNKIRNESIERAYGRVKGRIVGEYGDGGASGIAVYGSGSVKARRGIKEINASIRDGQYWPTSRRGVKRFTGGSLLEKARVPGLYRIDDPNNPRNRGALISPNNVGYQAGLGYYTMTEFGGIYGFLSQSITGIPQSTKPILANAGEMTSFERMYWDRMNLGGLAPTPGLSEIFRRFLPHKYHSNTLYNPIANTMPSWLPGSAGEEPGYFIDYRTGDPYAKLPNGEVRLPGAAYERLHGIGRADLSMRGSQLGYDEQHMYQYLTGQKEPFSSFLEEIMEKGSRIHSRIQSQWRKEGILEGAEVPIKDTQYDITGTIDAILKGPGGRQIAEIKTLSDPRWHDIVELGHTDPKHLAQLNFYMHETGIHQGKLVYVRRSDMAQTEVPVSYNAGLWQSTVSHIQNVRGRINREIDQGMWAPGALYNDVEKFKILADVAPWSEQYRRYRDYLTHLDEAALTDEERATIRQVKMMVSQRTKNYEFAPYVARDARLVNNRVTLDQRIDATTFTTFEDPLHPVRLAGITPNDAGLEYLDKVLRHARHLTIGVDADENSRIAKDTLRTQRAVLYLHGQNVNRYMIEHGLATENNDNSAAAVYVKYTPIERFLGRFLESLGHMPIPFIHNKFMPLDDALEMYKRTQVYGKEWQDWKHPFKDFVFPFFETTAQQGFPGLLAGAGAAFLWIGGTPEAKMWAPIVAAGGILATKLWRHIPGHEIPGYRQRENDINEYYDILKYLKYRGLYEGQRRWIAKHEHHDIDTLIQRISLQGKSRKELVSMLKGEKRKLIRSKAQREEITELNRAIRESSAYREQFALTRADALAIQYHNLQKQTLYGADPYDVQNVLLALTSKQREFFTQFLKAPAREHKEILRVTPDNWHRFLEAAWGAKPEPRPNLNQYFRHHYLPPPDWAGWSIHNNLDDYRLVTFKNEALNLTSQGFWPQDEERVSLQGNRDVQPFRPSRHWHFENAKKQLSDVASGLGLSDVDIQYLPNMYGSNRYNVQLQDDNDKSRQYAQYGYVPPNLSKTLDATMANPSTMFTR